jgi:flagellar export protein FliJ
VQRIRKIERDQQSRVLSLAMQDLSKIRAEIQQLEMQHEMELKRMSVEAQQENFSMLDAQVSIKYREELRSQLRRKRKEEEAAVFKVEQERLKLVEREKVKKVLDKLEERDLEKHELEQRKIENQDMDEVASVRQFARDARKKSDSQRREEGSS